MGSKLGGDVGYAGEAQQADRRIAKRAAHLWPSATTDTAAVLAKGHVADPVQTVLDGPVASPDVQQPFGVGPPRWQASDGVVHFSHLLAVAARNPLQAADLGRARPGEMRHDPRAGLKMSANTTTVVFGLRRSLREV